MTTVLPSADTDHATLAETFETVSYAPPAVPLEVDEFGLPVAAPEPNDPDDER